MNPAERAAVEALDHAFQWLRDGERNGAVVSTREFTDAAMKSLKTLGWPPPQSGAAGGERACLYCRIGLPSKIIQDGTKWHYEHRAHGDIYYACTLAKEPPR